MYAHLVLLRPCRVWQAGALILSGRGKEMHWAISGFGVCRRAAYPSNCLALGAGCAQDHLGSWGAHPASGIYGGGFRGNLRVNLNLKVVPPGIDAFMNEM